MTFTHVLLTRPAGDSHELARLVTPLGLCPVVQPAFEYRPVEAAAGQPEVRRALERAGEADLLIFTSPRSVAHGLRQLPPGCASRAGVAAVGPASARALEDCGVRVSVRAVSGFTSEALLGALGTEVSRGRGQRNAFILAAPGGRDALERGLRARGWTVHKYLVYRSVPADLDHGQLARLADADGLLAVWTSGNAMKALADRLPQSAWARVLAGDWVVISERLAGLARGFGPRRIHLAGGPGNDAILAAIRNLL